MAAHRYRQRLARGEAPEDLAHEGRDQPFAIAASTFKLDNLVMLVDCNGIQADGLIFVNIEPVANKWRSFGWDTCEIDGNDMGALCNALIRARPKDGKPKAIIMRTVPGKGVLRVADNEWALLSAELDGGRHG